MPFGEDLSESELPSVEGPRPTADSEHRVRPQGAAEAGRLRRRVQGHGNPPSTRGRGQGRGPAPQRGGPTGSPGSRQSPRPAYRHPLSQRAGRRLPLFRAGMDRRRSLHNRLDAAQKRNKPLPPRDIARMIEIIAGAVDSARMVHRDLKPENILIAADADDADWFTKVKVADFGLALPGGRGRGPGGSAGRHAGLSVARPLRQVPGGVDGFSDVYALGVILYECLTGALPPLAKKDGPVQFPKGRSGKAPKTLKMICLKCLEYGKDKRYYDEKTQKQHQRPALQLAEDLQAFREHRETKARPLNPVQRLGLWAWSRPSQAAFVPALYARSAGGFRSGVCAARRLNTLGRDEKPLDDQTSY